MFCLRAKALIKGKGVEFEEIDVTFDIEKRREMANMSGSFSVPQVFVNESYLGDCEGIFSLDREGKLNQKLGI